MIYNLTTLEELANLKTPRINKVVIVWGRFQPPHVGHQQLFDFAMSHENADIYIMPSDSCDTDIKTTKSKSVLTKRKVRAEDIDVCIVPENPLTIQEKLTILGNMYPEYNFLYMNLNNIFKILELFKEIYPELIIITGPDRDYSTILKRIGYTNGKSIPFTESSGNRFSINIGRDSKPIYQPVSATFIRKAIYYHQDQFAYKMLGIGKYKNKELFEEELLPILVQRIGRRHPEPQENDYRDFLKEMKIPQFGGRKVPIFFEQYLAKLFVAL